MDIEVQRHRSRFTSQNVVPSRKHHALASASLVRLPKREIDKPSPGDVAAGREFARREGDVPHVSQRPEPGVWNDQERGLVGSLFWSLDKGDRWVLGPECAFLFTGCWRQAIGREVYMLDEPASRKRRVLDVVGTVWRRWVTGESLLLDLYEAVQDDAELGISSDRIGGSLYSTSVDRGPLLARKTVYFGSQPGVSLRIESPLQRLRLGMSGSELRDVLMRVVYGPGWVLQKFESVPGLPGDQLILQVDGDPFFRELKAGQTLRTDPRHAHAWDATVSWRLVKFGTITDRLLRGSVPFQVEFVGPGRLWLSNMSFSDGYLGNIFTPSHWIFMALQIVRRALGLLNPGNWA